MDINLTDRLRFLTGMHLAQIQISKHNVNFNFHEGCQIAIESSFEHLGGSGISRFDATEGEKNFTATSLLEEFIIQVDDADSGLLLTFSNEERLKIILNGRGSSCSISTADGIFVFD